MKFKIFFFFFVIITSRKAIAQPFNYIKTMAMLYAAVDSSFYIPSSDYYKEKLSEDKPSYLWPLCAMFDTANEMAKVDKNDTALHKVFNIIGKYKSNSAPAPAYASYTLQYGGGSRFYDDNQWIGITAMDVYKHTGNKKWLQSAKEIYRFMMTGYDTLTGGGLYWQEDKKTTKNTCSNGPGIVLAAELYKVTYKQQYLATAIDLYKWAKAHLQSPDALYFDNINVKTGATDKRKYSYNAGTMLHSAVLLYQITKQPEYLADAKQTANAAMKYFFADNRFKDSWWFNAVLLRGLIALHNVDKNPVYLSVFKIALDNALVEAFDNNNKVILNKHKNLVEYGGLLEAVSRYAQMQLKGVIK